MLNALPAQAAIGSTSFSPRVVFNVNGGPTSVANSDLDGDGKVDLVTTNYGSVAGIGNTISVLRNTSANGLIAFAPKVDFAATAGPHELAIGDIDGDSKPDVVVSNFDAYASGISISVFRNTSTSGTIAFAPKIDFTVNKGPMGIDLGDIDGDGKVDVVVTQFNDGIGTLVSVLRNTSTVGNVTFAPKVDFTVGAGPYGVKIGDLDGDGKPELVVSNNGTAAGDGNTVSVLRNTSTIGTVNFAPKVDFTTNNGPRGIAIGDLDGDSKPDLLISHFGGSGSGNTVSALRNTSTTGNIAFAPKVDFAVGNGAIHLVLGDIDKDGKVDAAVANFGTTGNNAILGVTVSVLRNTSTSGNIVFAPKVDFTTGAGPHGLAIGDLDGDSWLDLAIADYGDFSGSGSTVSVLRNQGGSPTTIIPNVVGLTQAVAQQTLAGAGLPVGTVTQTYHNSVPAGNVISQNPTAGASVVNGTPVDLVISLGPLPATVPVPNIVGLTQAAAQQAITAASLAVGTVTQAYNNSVPAGNVISQTPSAGASVAPNTAVNLVVSLGIAPVTVPNVVGLTQTAAQQAITGASLAVGTVTQAYNNSVPAGSVISQNPVAGLSVAPGTAVSLLVSRGPTPGNVTIGPNSFAPKVDFTTNGGPTGIVIGDLDGDGQPDIAIANFGNVGNIGSTVSVLRNTGTGGNLAFAPKLDFTTSAGPHEIALGDLNSDGKPEVVVTNYGAYASGNTVSVLRNTSTVGSLAFAAKVDFTTNAGPIGIAIQDMDGDGKPDLLIANFNDGTGNTVSILRNTSTAGGALSFAAKVDFTAGTGAHGVAVGDVDGDGKPDLVVANNGSLAGNGNTISVLRNTSTSGNLAFAPKVDFTTGNGPRGVVLGDLDGDGKLDVLTSNFGNSGNGNTLSALRNTSTSGNIAFAPKVDLTANLGSLDVVIGDIDGDGKLDAVANNFGTAGDGTTVSAFHNTSTVGALSFAPKVDFTTGAGPHGLTIGDIDNDSWLDLAVTSYGSGNGATIAVLHNLNGASTTVAAPNVVGLTQSAAQQAITGAGLVVGTITQSYDNSVPAGSVISQNPAAGAAVASGSAVNLVVSLGPVQTTVTVPNVVGLTQSAAQQAITGAGLTVGTITQSYNNSVPAGNVISQNPTAGALVAGNSAVNLVVSLGVTPVIVPNVVGLSQTAAQQALTGAGLTVGTVSQVYNNSVPAGNVVSQTPAAGNGVAPNTAVSLVVSRGPTLATITVNAFAPKVDFIANGGPTDLVSSDLDGDGQLDLAIANYGNPGSIGGAVSVLRGASTSGVVTFATKIDVAANAGPYEIAAGDLNGDGKPDLVVTNYGAHAGGNTVSVLRNTSTVGNLAFATKVDFAVNNGPIGIAIGDIDGDGKPDLAVAQFNEGAGALVSVLRNTSSGATIAFAPKLDFTAGVGLVGVALGDLDGDGKPELVVTNNGSFAGSGNTISVFRNTSTSGNISFAAKVDFTTNNGPRGVALSDLDGDGKLDVLVANFGNGSSGNTVSVLRNTSTSGSVALAAKVDFVVGSGALKLAVRDLNSDGKPDVVVSNFSSGNVSVLQNASTSGAISLAAKVDFATGSGPFGVVAGDFDSDSWPDVAVTNYGDGTNNTVSVLRNLLGVPPTVTVPNVVGLTQAAAQQAVTSASLTVGAITQANDNLVPAGSVISQNPAAGSSATAGSAVALVVSLGPTPVALTVSKAGAGSGTVTSTPAGISCGATCSANFIPSTVITLTAIASTGSTFTGWSGAGCTGTGTCRVTLDAAKSVTANFTLNTYALSVTKAGTGSGTVTSTPVGISCGATCSASFNYGTVVTLTAAASTGSTFTGWSGAGCTGTGSCVVTIDAAKSVVANFALNTYALSVTKAGNGAGAVTSTPAGISCGATCSVSFNFSTVVTLAATASTGSTFTGWSGAGCTGTGSCVVTMDAVKGVTANFTLNTFVLSVTKTGNGAGTVTSTPAGISCGATCSSTYNYGTVVTLAAAASTGSTFAGWSGASCTGTGACAVTVDAAKSVNANFTLNTYTLAVSKVGSGTVTSTPAGISCGATCSAPYNYNTTVTLNAVADPGWTFTGWSGDVVGTTTSQAVTVNSNKAVVATFSDLIFADGFETGNLSAWSSAATNAGNLSVTPAARLVGAQGLQATIANNTAMYVTDDRPNAESRYRARFYFDPNTIRMTSGDAHYLFYGYSGTTTVVLRIEFRYLAPNYQLRAAVMNNLAVWQTSSWFNIADAPHFVEIDWQAATSAGSTNGYLTFWMDGVQMANLTGVSNSSWRIDRVQLGAVAGIDTGTRGTYYFDAFESHRRVYSGPASGVALAADTPVFNLIYLPVVANNQ
ncbi:MAG: FG-GAP-like repeat-containing protein [Caldilineaceae bacterium]